MLICLIGLFTLVDFSSPAFCALTYEDAYKQVREKGADADSGKIKADDFVDFCTRLLADTDEGSKAKAYILAARGNGYRNMGDMQKARQDIDASLATNDSIPGGYENLGHFFILPVISIAPLMHIKKQGPDVQLRRGKRSWSPSLS